MLSFVYPTINTVRFIAIEKEKQLKEAMKIMGLPNWLHWTGWFVKTMIFMTISISIVVALFKVSASIFNCCIFNCHSPAISFRLSGNPIRTYPFLPTPIGQHCGFSCSSLALLRPHTVLCWAFSFRKRIQPPPLLVSSGLFSTPHIHSPNRTTNNYPYWPKFWSVCFRTPLCHMDFTLFFVWKLLVRVCNGLICGDR